MAHTAHSDHFANFAEFYPYYLEEHRNLVSRRLHFIGSLGVIGCIAMAIATGDWLWLPAAVVCGYGFASVGHFFFEKNRPATFRHPLYSLMGDWVMFKDICVGKISLSVTRGHARSRGLMRHRQAGRVAHARVWSAPRNARRDQRAERDVELFVFQHAHQRRTVHLRGIEP